MGSFLGRIFLTALLFGSAVAQAQNVFNCERSYRADSYGRGLEAGFTATNLEPAFKDSLCYALGHKVGRDLRSRGCSTDFNLGLERGRVLHAVDTGNPCYIAGYQAGRAAFRTGARENNDRLASAACIRTYRAAYDDGYRRTGNAVPSSDRVLAECYRGGYADGEWFQIEGSDFFPF